MKVELRFFGQLIEIVGSNTFELEITKLEYDAILTQLNKQIPSIKPFTIQLAQNNKIIKKIIDIPSLINLFTKERCNVDYYQHFNIVPEIN